MGAKCHPRAKELLIAADGRGSNGSRCRSWKVALQEVAIRLDMPTHVSHLRACASAVTVTAAQIGALHIRPDRFHGDCNYALLPTSKEQWSSYFHAVPEQSRRA